MRTLRPYDPAALLLWHVMPELTNDFQTLPEEYQLVIRLAEETHKISGCSAGVAGGRLVGRCRLSCQCFP